MISRRGKYRGGTGYGSGLRPVLLALLAVLIPTACVLWFLNEAVQNERLASRQKLLEAYRGQLSTMRDRLDTYWRRRSEALDKRAARSSVPIASIACVAEGLADAVVFYDDSGRLLYPAPPAAMPEPPGKDETWTEAEQLEYASNDPAAAAAAYAKVAAATSDDPLAALSLQAQARCLAKAGETAEAIRVLTEELGRAEYAGSLDAQGRLIAADAQLRALELIDDRHGQRFEAVAKKLIDYLDDYNGPISSAQRVFLAKGFLGLTDKPWNFPTLEAEELAAAYVESHPTPAEAALQPAGLPGVWRFASPSGQVVGLWREETVLQRVTHFLGAHRLSEDAQIGIIPPGAEMKGRIDHVLPAGEAMPGWRLTLTLHDSGDPNAFMNHRIALNIWIAVLVIGAMSIVGVFVAVAFRRQMRLTQLRNDLLATVSHELKTPLASIRLFIDTLLDAEHLDTPKAREYLRLAAKENARLSHLIDNFLSFSRMERGKQAFEFSELRANEIAERAAELVAERFQGAESNLEVRPEAGDAVIRADADALVTAVLNLLDNARKYTGESKQVVLRTYAENDHVCFSVNDNGVGLSPRAVKNVFRPFYQVDRRLSRDTGGCGLGLAIVRFIVEAHQGSVRVESRPGEGSTFIVSIPRIPE